MPSPNGLCSVARPRRHEGGTGTEAVDWEGAPAGRGGFSMRRWEPGARSNDNKSNGLKNDVSGQLYLGRHSRGNRL